MNINGHNKTDNSDKKRNTYKIAVYLFLFILLSTPFPVTLFAQPPAHTIPLSCQARPQDSLAGGFIEIDEPLYKDYFSPKEDVWAALRQKDIPHPFKHQQARVYLVSHRPGIAIADGHRLQDVSGGYKTIDLKEEKGAVIYVKVWTRPKIREKGYDLIVDFQPFGVFNKDQDLLDGGTQKGFYVPANWVHLDHLRFNHNPESISSDAVNSSKNIKTAVLLPEWQQGVLSSPAIYLKDKLVTVLPQFSAAKKVSSCTINAYQDTGKLGNLSGGLISFSKNVETSVYFKTASRTPASIQTFYQKWRWVQEKIEGTKRTEILISTTINKIYIILDFPQSPWTLMGEKSVWTDVLDYSCQWAEGLSNPVEAATVITQKLNELPPLQYQPKSTDYSDPLKPQDSFNLSRFLADLAQQQSGAVNAYDMARAVVTFTNALGCNTAFHYLPDFNCRLQCVQAVGKKIDCNMKLKKHAVATIDQQVFDAAFKANDDNSPSQPEQLINLPLQDYFKRIILEGNPGPLRFIPFTIKGYNER